MPRIFVASEGVAELIENLKFRFSVQAKSKNARVFEISAHVKDPQVVKINPEPCTTTRLIVYVASAR